MRVSLVSPSSVLPGVNKLRGLLLSCAGRHQRQKIRVAWPFWGLLVLVPMVVFVTPLAPWPAARRVVAALRRCVASRAGIMIIIPRDCQVLCI